MKINEQGPFKGLSTRSANNLLNFYTERPHPNWHCSDRRIDIRKLRTNDIKQIIKNDIEDGLLELKKIRNCGIKAILEITQWVGLDKLPDMSNIKRKAKEELNAQVDAHMSTGVDENDEYWKLFKCKDAVNDALVAAYKLGYKRGLQEGKK